MTTLSSTERGEHTPGIVERLRELSPKIMHEPASQAMAEAADLISELVGALDGVLSINDLTGARKRTECIEAARAVAAKARGGAE